MHENRASCRWGRGHGQADRAINGINVLCQCQGPAQAKTAQAREASQAADSAWLTNKHNATKETYTNVSQLKMLSRSFPSPNLPQTLPHPTITTTPAEGMAGAVPLQASGHKETVRPRSLAAYQPCQDDTPLHKPACNHLAKKVHNLWHKRRAGRGEERRARQGPSR
jgi:hypothetical protein